MEQTPKFNASERLIWIHSLNRILNSYNITFQILSEEKSQENLKYDSFRYVTLVSYLIVQLNTFIDEWDWHVKDDKIKSFKVKFKPIIKAIRGYTDIEYIRNSLLAHSRDKQNNNSSLLLVDSIESYNIPVDILDLIYISKLLNYLQNKLQIEFNTDLIIGQLNSIHLKQQKSVRKNFQNLEEVNSKFLKSL